MKTAWYIAKKDLLQTFKDRNSLIFMLLMPMILITIIGLALGNAFGSSGPIQVTVAINNQDSGANSVGQAIIDAYKYKNSQIEFKLKQYQNEQQVIDALQETNSSVDAGIIIPAGTTDDLMQAIKNKQPANNLVKFYTAGGSNDTRGQIAQSVVTSVVNGIVNAEYASAAAIEEVNTICNQPGNHCEQSTIDPQTISRVVSQASQQAAQTSPVKKLTTTQVQVNSFDQYVPGYAIFFALFSINAVAGTILQEKEEGTFRRLLIAPVQKYALLGGKVLAQFVLTSLQLAVLFIFGYLFFHIHINNLPAILLLVLGTSFGATGLGIILVSLVKTRRQLNPIVTLVTLISSAIGGIWWPLWIEPTWLQQLAKIGLPAWAMEGLNNVMIYNKGLVEVLPDILGLIAYGLICYIIGLRLFRFQEKVA